MPHSTFHYFALGTKINLDTLHISHDACSILIASKGRWEKVVLQLYTFSGAGTYTASPGAGNSVPLLFSNATCTGSETVLTSCLYDSNPGGCNLIQRAAGVICITTLSKPVYFVLLEKGSDHIIMWLCYSIFFYMITPWNEKRDSWLFNWQNRVKDL